MKNAAKIDTLNTNTTNLTIENILRQLQENLGLNISIDANGKLVINDQPQQPAKTIKAEPAPVAKAEPSPTAKTEPASVIKVEPAPVYQKVNASVAGTTFIPKDDKGGKHNGQRIMALLKACGCRYIIRLERTSFGDEPALRVWVFPATKAGKLVDGNGPANKVGYPIGYIAAKNGDLAKVLGIVDSVGGTKSLKINSTIVGGTKLANGERLNFGMRLVIER